MDPPDDRGIQSICCLEGLQTTAEGAVRITNGEEMERCLSKMT
jgi:hypothetical protein